MTASVLRTETENAVQTAFSHDVTLLSLTTRQCFSDLQEAPSGNRSHYKVLFRYPAAGAAQRHVQLRKQYQVTLRERPAPALICMAAALY